MDKLREAAHEIQHESDAGKFHVTFSWGIATYPCANTVLDLTQAADDALYKAKRSGRNPVVIADQDTAIRES